MYLAYDGIVFDVLFLNGWAQNAVWSDDGADFLYWHHIIDVTAVLNPEIMAETLMPSLKAGKLNARLKRELERRKAAQRARDKAAANAGLLPPGGRVPGVPIKTKIQPPNEWRPRTDLSTTKSNYFFNSNGDICEGVTPGVANFPLVTQIAPGIPYPADLAAQTAPVQEPGGSTQVEYTDGGTISPGTIVNSTTGVYGARPERLLPAKPFTPRGVGGLPGPPRPATGNEWNLPQPQVEQFQLRLVPQTPRPRFPGNPNLPASDIELRDRLQMPRRQLKVWINSGPDGAPEFILNLPYDGCRSDAKDGPKCVDQHTIAIHGNVTGVKRLVFECFEALPLFFDEQGKGDAQRMGGRVRTIPAGIVPGGAEPENNEDAALLTPPIISNRWTMRQEPDPETYLNSTVIEGKAVFRLDILSRLGMTADQLRSYILPPVATGYVRKPVTMVIGGEGNELLYNIVDHQQLMNNPGGHRWGVHSVVTVNSVLVNNPVDMTFTNHTPFMNDPTKRPQKRGQN